MGGGVEFARAWLHWVRQSRGGLWLGILGRKTAHYWERALREYGAGFALFFLLTAGVCWTVLSVGRATEFSETQVRSHIGSAHGVEISAPSVPVRTASPEACRAAELHSRGELDAALQELEPALSEGNDHNRLVYGDILIQWICFKCLDLRRHPLDLSCERKKFLAHVLKELANREGPPPDPGVFAYEVIVAVQRAKALAATNAEVVAGRASLSLEVLLAGALCQANMDDAVSLLRGYVDVSRTRDAAEQPGSELVWLAHELEDKGMSSAALWLREKAYDSYPDNRETQHAYYVLLLARHLDSRTVSGCTEQFLQLGAEAGDSALARLCYWEAFSYSLHRLPVDEHGAKVALDGWGKRVPSDLAIGRAYFEFRAAPESRSAARSLQLELLNNRSWPGAELARRELDASGLSAEPADRVQP